jgi:outer membrane immunogenic protein
VAALLAATHLAAAADMGMPMKAPPRPMPALVAYSWTGCYIGVNVGGGFANGNSTVTGAGIATTGNAQFNGVIGGGQLGCNYQVSSWGLRDRR